MSHTPGPYSVGMPGGFNACMIYGPDPHSAVAQVYMIPSNTTVAECEDMANDYKDIATGLANARLFAAAPDLLKACKSAEELMSEQSHRPWSMQESEFGCKDCGTSDCQTLRTLPILRAAIAKAEGKATDKAVL